MEKKKSEVVVLISGESEKEQANTTRDPKVESFGDASNQKRNPQSPEIVLKSPAKPPKFPRSVSLIRQKPKSRFVEQTAPPSAPPHGTAAQEPVSSLYTGSPTSKSSSTPRTPKDDEDEEEEEEEEEIFKKERFPSRRRRFIIRLSVEWLILVLALSFLVMSVLVEKLRAHDIWGLEIWKWCLMVLAVSCGRLVGSWIIAGVVFLIERNFLFRKKVLYFVYGLKKSIRVFLWSSLVSLSWFFIFIHGDTIRSDKTEKVLSLISRLLISVVLGSSLWVVKTLWVKMLASSFHLNRFFDRIQESIFHQYILQTLSGPPKMESAEEVGPMKSRGQLSFRTKAKGRGKGEMREVIDVSKLYRVSQEKVSAWTIKGLASVIRSSGLSTLSNTMHESFVEEEKRGREISSECDAELEAYRIFKNVARPNYKYIDHDDLLRFLSKEEVEYVMPLFAGAADTGKIKKSALKNWVVNAYIDRKSLSHSLNDTKTAVKQLDKLATILVLIASLIIALILTGIATTKILIFVSSQLLLVGFMFGNTCKMAFEAIIFVFVMHPFDVGDRCVVDEIQMTVEEINILTTVFLKFNNEKVYYPNSVLAMKPISNYYRSPDMSDSVEFWIAVSTTVESIAALKAKIKMYIESKPSHWHPNHSVVVKDIEDVNKMNIALYVNHTMNFQNMWEKHIRRSELVLELRRILDELVMQYDMQPQSVRLTYGGSTPLPMAVTQTIGI